MTPHTKDYPMVHYLGCVLVPLRVLKRARSMPMLTSIRLRRRVPLERVRLESLEC